MTRFVEGAARDQGGLFPAHLEDVAADDNPVRAVDAFVDALDLRALGFDAVDPSAAERPGYHPAVLLKLYLYGYLNAVASSRRLEREAGRNVELMWLTGRLAPDHKTIADFRKDHGAAMRRFPALQRRSSAAARGDAPVLAAFTRATWRRMVGGIHDLARACTGI